MDLDHTVPYDMLKRPDVWRSTGETIVNPGNEQALIDESAPDRQGVIPRTGVRKSWCLVHSIHLLPRAGGEGSQCGVVCRVPCDQIPWCLTPEIVVIQIYRLAYIVFVNGVLRP